MEPNLSKVKSNSQYTYVHNTYLFQQKIFRGKTHEKIWLNIKHFIIQKNEVKFVSFSSEESLAIEKFGRACVYVCT